jgi:hypothetical protein
MFPQEVTALLVVRRPDWPWHETATAVWTDVVQDIVYAVGAERAFVGADAGFLRVWRQQLVAVFAGGSQLKHRFSLFHIVNEKRRTSVRR